LEWKLAGKKCYHVDTTLRQLPKAGGSY
jgi:hypothetical protein